MKRIQAKGSVLGAFGATAVSLSLLVGWTRQLQPGWLIAAAAAFVAAAALTATWRTASRTRRGLIPLIIALALLLTGVTAAALFTHQFRQLETHWPEILERRQAALGEELARMMSELVERGRSTSGSAARLASRPRRDETGIEATADLFEQLGQLREQSRVDGLAVYTAAGNLVAWAGHHRGPMPDSIWIRDVSAYFKASPLFSYLYLPVPVEGREEYAIAAVLVETGILNDGYDVAIGDVVAARTRTRASFRQGGGTDAVWSLIEAGDTIVSARLEPSTQSDWRSLLERSARAVVLLSAIAAFLAFASAWLRSPYGRGRAAVLPLLLLVPLAAAAPFGEAIGADRLFSPLLFTLPLPGDMSLGRLLALLLPLAALAAALSPASSRTQLRAMLAAPSLRSPSLRERVRRAGTLRIMAGMVVVAVAYPLALRLLLAGATTALLQAGSVYWLGLQVVAAILLALVTRLAMPNAAPMYLLPAAWARPAGRRALFLTMLVLSAGLGIYASAGAHPYAPVRLSLAALWAVPFALAAVALAPLAGRTGAFSRWLVAGWLAATVVMPFLWVAQVDARLQRAEHELRTLGTRADPYVEFLLVNFGREAVARFDSGEDGVQLLYRTWVASGLAQEPYPAHIVLWTASGFPEVQLGSAPAPTTDEVQRLLDIVREASGRAAPQIMAFTDMPTMSRLLTVPMADGSLITVRIPPRRTLDRTSAVAPFLGIVSSSSARLNLVEVTGPDPVQESIQWASTPNGWRSEAEVKYPDGWYHAHLAIPLPPAGVRLARAALLATFDLTLFALLWVLGVAGRGGSAVPVREWARWLGTLRARITLALFTFFLIPTAVFGWAAYSALAGEVERAARTVAQHSAGQAVLEFQDGAGDLRDLAAHAGTDVLRYQGGELIDVSSREAWDLGIYNAWMPPGIYQRIESGEEQDAIETQRLGSSSYVIAYRALPPSGTLGVPMSLSAGDTALRQRQFAHLVLFAAVIGALLSLALSLAVGRTLAGPIGLLRRASAAVGAGSLRVRLPERPDDEFGQLFASFNRMTRRLRRARARELRTARVLAWGEMARQIAHEIKNPLTPIKLAVQHLRRAHADRHPDFDDILESNVSQVLAEIDRLSEIARAFSRYGAPSLASGPVVPVDAPSVIREALTLYRSGDRHVRYIEDVEPDLPPILARADELKEVLLNLVENSRAAFDAAGDITVGAAVAGDGVAIEVADNGRGVPPDLLLRVFEPHFSTRSSGTGLGLAIVRRLVESWGGTVEAENRPEGGTVVRIRVLKAHRP
ncbi:MAG: ATP-binding protein [Gemmatimonadota bacterium]